MTFDIIITFLAVDNMGPFVLFIVVNIALRCSCVAGNGAGPHLEAYKRIVECIPKARYQPGPPFPYEQAICMAFKI